MSYYSYRTQTWYHTIAIYSDIDIHAQHVLLADEAHCVGQASASQSYLNQDNILAIAQQAKVDAIHPGYDFYLKIQNLLKNVRNTELFCRATLQGHSCDGAKSQAKQLMSDAGVPITKGYHGDNQDEAFLAQQADVIGYPVMIKACAGGGSKGMRIIDSANDFMEQLSTAKREAKKSFGNDHVLIETFIKEPRHIEIQIFCDTHGNGVYLFDRDCSIQRRHQKIIEEAPHRVYQMQHAKPWAKPLYKQLKLSSMSEQAR